MSTSMIFGTALWGMLMGVGFSVAAFTPHKEARPEHLAAYFVSSVYFPALAGALASDAWTKQMRLEDTSSAALHSLAFFAIAICIARVATIFRQRNAL